MDKILLSDEETYKLLAGCEEINCLFKVKSNCTPCARMMKAQHLKSVKAVLEAIEEELKETDDGWFIEFKDYEALKKELLENFDKLEGK